MCIRSFLVVYFAYHFSKNVFVYNATCTMFIVQLFIQCSSFIGGIKVKGIHNASCENRTPCVFPSQVCHQLIFPEAVSMGHSIYNAYVIRDHV